MPCIVSFLLSVQFTTTQFLPRAFADENEKTSAAATAPGSEGPQSQPKAVVKQPFKPWKLSTEPIFKGPSLQRFSTISDLTGRDRQILGTLDYKPTGTKLRLDQLKKLSTELKKTPPRSEAFMTTVLGMLRLYEEQGMVFEWMRVVGMSDPKYPDLNQTLKNIRRQQAQRYQELILNFPKNPNVRKWKYKLLVARLKLGDPSVRDEALVLLKTLQGSEYHELASVGLAVDAAANRLPSPFGSVEKVLQASTDQYESAAFKLLLAEQEIAKNRTTTALAMIQDVIATGKNIRRSDKAQTPGTFLEAASSLLINIALKSSKAVNQEVLQTFVNNDLVTFAQSYLEQFALKSYGTQLSAALKAYADALALGQSNDELKMRIETRMLDLTIASGDPKMMMIAWERIFSREAQKTANLEPHMLQSISTLLSRVKSKPDKELTLRLVMMHDSFAKGFPSYAAREDYELKMIEALAQAKLLMDVGRRSEKAIGKFKEPANRISALQYNLKARQELMGLGDPIRILSTQKISGDPALVSGYIVNADKLRALLSERDAQQYLYLTAYVSLLSGNMQASLTRYQDAMTRAPRHPSAAEAAGALIETLMSKKELVAAEKMIRLMIKLGIVPTREPYRNLSKTLEQIVLDDANRLFAAKQFDAAAKRYADFQKEFPASPNASQALERAAASYVQGKKTETAMTYYELYLKQYPRLPQAKEVRWTTAELARISKFHLKAAEQYQLFGTLYPAEADSRKVFLRAAESLKDAGKAAESISAYERYLKGVRSFEEQKKTLEAMSELAKKTNNSALALSVLERLVKIVKAPDDILRVSFNLLLMYQKQNRDDLSKKVATAILAMKPGIPESYKLQSKARLVLARYELTSLRTRQIMNQKDLKLATESLLKDYERVKTDLLAPCEIPGVDWCSLGYYEVSKLSNDLAKLLAGVEPNRDLDEQVLSELKSIIMLARDKFRSEAKSFAGKADEAVLSSGSPDPETTERIRLHLQSLKQVKSETSEEPTTAGSTESEASEDDTF
jgi:TolA-binding protein